MIRFTRVSLSERESITQAGGRNRRTVGAINKWDLSRIVHWAFVGRFTNISPEPRRGDGRAQLPPSELPQGYRARDALKIAGDVNQFPSKLLSHPGDRIQLTVSNLKD
jgi:hypothetical protein